MAQLMPNAHQTFNDANGIPLAGGLLYSYAAGTSTPQATYTDQTASTPNTNPLVLDAYGGAFVFINNDGYKFVLTDSLGNQQWSIDNVYLIEPGIITATQIANGAVGTAQIANSAVGASQIATGAVGSTQIANGAVGATQIANGAITATQLATDIDFSSLENMIEVVFKRTDDGVSGGRILAIPQYPWSNPSLLTPPTTLPVTAGIDAKWSPDGRFLAVGMTGSPYIQVYERAGLNFNALGTPGTLPQGAVSAVCWSPNGDFLATVGAVSPYLNIYQRQGLNFTKLSDPVGLPGAAGANLAWSSNGEFLFVNESGSDVRLYNVNGTTFTEISGSFGFSGNDGYQGCSAWSPDSQFLALGNSSGTGNFFNFYKRTGVTGSAGTISGGQPGSAPSRMAWSPNSTYLVMGISTSPYLACYSLNGSTLTKFTPTGLGTNIPGAVSDVSWSPNGTFIAVAFAGSPYFQVYAVNGTTWTLQANPTNQPTSTGQGIGWSPTSEFLSVATTASPFIYNYQTSGILPTGGMLWSRTWFDV